MEGQSICITLELWIFMFIDSNIEATDAYCAYKSVCSQCSTISVYETTKNHLPSDAEEVHIYISNFFIAHMIKAHCIT